MTISLPSGTPSDKCLKCGTLAFNLSGVLSEEGALKSGCLHGDAGLHTDAGTLLKGLLLE